MPSAPYVTQGRRLEHLLSTTKTVPTLQLSLIIYMELFNKNMQQITLKSNKSLIDWQPMIDVNSHCQGVDRCPAQVRMYSWNNNGHNIVMSQ